MLLQACACPATAGQEDPLPKVLHVAFSLRVFPDVDQRDAKIAMELWARELSRKAGIPQAQVILFDNPGEIEGMVRSGKIHLVTLPPLDYLAWHQRLNIEPAYVAANKSGRNMEYVLIVRRDSGITHVRNLKGKTVAISKAINARTGSLWFTVLLMREGIHNYRDFSEKPMEETKPSQTVMGVFFRQYQAAVVTRGSLETSFAVNPQLNKELVILAQSRSLVGDLSCLPATVGKRMKKAMDDAAMTLHETAVGKQMTTLFHIDRVIPFSPSHMAGVEALLKDREMLKKTRGKQR